jgi:hypothetical protein
MKRILVKLLRKLKNIWIKVQFVWHEDYTQYTLTNIQYYDRNDFNYENKRRLEDTIYLDRFGFKVYSQNDEDGIITEIFNRIDTTNKIFIEFGVQNGLESNSHYLLHKGWTGLWLEGSKQCVRELSQLFEGPIKRNSLKVINAFITVDNINRLIGEEGKTIGEIDLLIIDIDGNDYHVWEAISCINPRVVVIEYNAKFPPPHEWIMPYNPKHIWDGSDLQGASLSAMEKLGNKLGYQLVGTNMNGVNAFFVRKDLTKDLFPKPATAENLYHSWGSIRYKSSGHRTIKYIGN